MISIKRFFDTHSDTSAESTLRTVLASFVRKLGETAVVVESTEVESFRNEIRSLHAGLTPDLPMNDVLITIGSATQALETYNNRVMRIVGNQGNEFRAILQLLQQQLSKMSGESTNSVDSLSKIGVELERFEGFKDLHPLKLHLTHCLSDLREEIEREKSASRDLIEKLQIDIEGFRSSDRARLECAQLQPAADAATGLLRQGECSTAIQAAIDKGTRHYVVVMVVNRVQQTNVRLGRAAGDLMLSRFKELMAPRFKAPDQLFRWTGPAMVAILERPQTLTVIRLVVKRQVEVEDDVAFEVESRSVHIPVSAAWSVFPFEATLVATEKHIHAFVASQNRPDFA